MAIDQRPKRKRMRPTQFTIVRLAVATAGVAAVIATVQQLAIRNRMEGPLPVIIGVCFGSAFVVATLKGEWHELATTCILLFPTSLTAAFAPNATLFVLFGSFVIGGILGVVAKHMGTKAPKKKKTRIT